MAAATLRRLTLYRLRADVQFADSPLVPSRGLGAAPPGALPDPRHPALGWRAYGPASGRPGNALPGIDWDAIRVAHCIPESGIELIPDDSYLLESGFERLNGVDFRKGCYVGQENTARMNWRQKINRRLVVVPVDWSNPDRQRVAYPALGLAVDHLRLEDIPEGTLPYWITTAA